MDGESGVHTVSVEGVRILLGQGIRGGRAMKEANLMKPAKTSLRDLNLGFFADNDANEDLSDSFEAFYTAKPTLTATRAAGDSAGAAFKKQAEISAVHATKDIYWRFIIEQQAMEYSGSGFTAAPGRSTPKAGDEYVTETTAAQVVNAALRFRFSKDSSCHLQALDRIMGFPASKPSSIRLKEILKSPKRAQIELYLRTVAPQAQRRLGALVSNNPDGELELRNHFANSTCSLTDLAACEALMQKVEDVATAQAKAAASASIKAADFEPGGSLPRGWIQGNLRHDLVP